MLAEGDRSRAHVTGDFPHRALDLLSPQLLMASHQMEVDLRMRSDPNEAESTHGCV